VGSRGARSLPPMYDLLYLAIIVGFFALMLAFVQGLAALGRDAAVDERDNA
jgi:serine/threonine protein kinase HipA of HipAB toxin-antitoxin module